MELQESVTTGLIAEKHDISYENKIIMKNYDTDNIQNMGKRIA